LHQWFIIHRTGSQAKRYYTSPDFTLFFNTGGVKADQNPSSCDLNRDKSERLGQAGGNETFFNCWFFTKNCHLQRVK
jgi:hypothetical protein